MGLMMTAVWSVRKYQMRQIRQTRWRWDMGWDLEVALDGTAHTKPLFVQIARAVSDDIRRGRLHKGTRLPGTRTLAEKLGVHRNTVLAAYEELRAEGWLTTRQ